MIEEIQNFSEQHSVGTLFVVPTPIGNLEDISQRSIDTLKKVDLIAAEDTRHSGELLKELDVQTKMISLHEHNFAAQIPKLLNILQAGQSIAQISDAGMPLISDPGQQLVQIATENNIPVVVIPGATAGLTALVGSGLSAQPHIFYGFLSPKKNQAQKQLEQLQEKFSDMTTIFYEAPHRIVETIKLMNQVFGDDQKIVLARELTKFHESYLRGTTKEVMKWFEVNKPRGEYVIVVGPTKKEITISDQQIIEMIINLIKEGQSVSDAIKTVSSKTKINKNYVYDLYHEKQ